MSAAGPLVRFVFSVVRVGASRLNNQLRLTPPQAYLAPTLEAALESLYRRYVARRPAGGKEQAPLTHSALRSRIWRVVREWERPNVHVEVATFLEGQRATHPADVVIRNGVPRAALFALATHNDDRHLAYLYRDSLPTIANDMGKDFRVYAGSPTAASLGRRLPHPTRSRARLRRLCSACSGTTKVQRFSHGRFTAIGGAAGKSTPICGRNTMPR